MKKAYHTNVGLANILTPNNLCKFGVRPENNEYLIFELFDLAELEKVCNEAVENDRRERGQKMSEAGRRAFTPKMMGMIFLIKSFRNWSYPRTAKEVSANVAIRAWLRLGDGAAIPRRQTIWRYGEIFKRQKVFQKPFGMTVEEARQLNSLYGRSVLAFDSTYVIAPIQRNNRLEWTEIRAGRGDQLWREHPRKKIHKDIQAAFSKKNKQVFFRL